MPAAISVLFTDKNTNREDATLVFDQAEYQSGILQVTHNMATIKLFGNLRAPAGGAAFDISGEDLGTALREFCRTHPALQEAIFDGSMLSPTIRVMVDGQDIELGQGLDTTLTESSSIAIFPPLAGG